MGKPKIRFKGHQEDWEQRKLSELSEKTFGGGTPKTSNESFWKGNIPWIQSSDLIEGSLFDVEPRKYISQEAVDKSATKLVPENSVAIVTRVGVGKLAFMPFSYATSQDFLSLSVLKTEPQFTVYALYKKLQSEINAVQGISIKGITKDELLAKKIMIPCYEEQEKIGSYLHSLDHLITLHQRKCEETKKLKKYMLQKMFPQNGNSVPEIRFSGFTEDWEQRKLEDYLEVSSEKNRDELFGKEDVLSVSGEVGIVNQIEFQGRSFAGASVANYGIVEVGDVVYTKSPLKSNPYGIIKTNKGKTGIVSTLYAVYKPKKNVDSEFVQIYFESDFRMNSYMHPLVNKGAKNDMKVSDANALKGSVFFPKIEEQIAVSKYFNSLDHLITLHQQKCDELRNIKKFMLQNMFI